MITEFKFPDVGEGITEGEIIQWFVKEGEPIRADQPMVEVETDKANVEIPSPRSGIVLKILAQPGEVVKVGQTLIIIGDKDDHWETEAPPAEKEPVSVGVVGVLEEAPEEEVVEEEKPEKKVLALPAVRALAKKLGLDITRIKGTGPGGRVTERDVRRQAEARQIEERREPEEVRVEREEDLHGPIETVPLRGMRRTIAKKMVKSIYTAPHVAIMDEANVTELVQLREKIKEAVARKGINLTYLPFIIKATIAGLKEYPFINASLDEEKETIIIKKYYNIGIAVDTTEGLMVPVIKEADKKSLLELASVLQELKVKARSRKIDLVDLKGGTFTISDYGALGGIYGTPIINYPEVAILGVGRVQERLTLREGQLVTQRIMALSLSFDHRVIDGGQATGFLNTVIRHLESPEVLLLE